MNNTNNVQQGPKPNPDNLIVHVAKILREDIDISFSAWKRGDVALRQPPINDDDHDSWDTDVRDFESWLYVAYSVAHAIDPKRADDALTDMVATNSRAKTKALKSAQSDPKRKANT